MENNKCSYSPDDDKLRLYPAHRLDKQDYDRAKAAGFRWAPKQELFFTTWHPGAEDLLVDWCGEIDDEDKSLSARAEERADRFEDYSENRAKDADSARAAVSAIADNIPLGQPILVGHHSEKHARRDAEKIENGMRKAVKMWEQSQYWKDRAAGAIRNAKYKERPDVRARRIKTIEADKRKQERTKAQAEKFLKLWSTKPTMENAIKIANYDHISHCFTLAEYPRNPPASQYEGSMGFWSALTEGVITADQAAELAIPTHERMIEWCDRWILHYENRLAYERAMLENAGGTVTDKTGPEKGGACRCWASPHGGWSYIQKVNKVSVTVLDNWGNGGRNFTRNIPFDKLKAVMTAAEVQEKRDTGMLSESDFKDGAGTVRGFFLRDAQLPERKPEPPKQDPEKAANFDALKDQLRAGVKIVVAPQLFATPPELAARMVDLAKPEVGNRVLEPSAGTGNLLRCLPGFMPFEGFLPSGACRQTAVDVVAVEINGDLTEALDKSGLAQRIICTDFLTCTVEGEPSSLGRFDCVIMNPPFVNGADIKHIQHARKFLKSGGRLVALCANGPRQREALQDESEHWEDLPAGSFAAEGTGVNVALLVLLGPEESKTEEPEPKPENILELKREQAKTLRNPVTSAPRGFQSRLFA
jgi:hypothetical protein